MRPLLLAGLIGMVSGLLGALALVLGLRLLTPPPLLLTVRVTDLVNAQVESLGKSLDDPAQRAVAAERFARALDAELDLLANREGAVVLAGGAALRGATDATEVLRDRINARLAEVGSVSPSSVPRAAR